MGHHREDVCPSCGAKASKLSIQCQGCQKPLIATSARDYGDHPVTKEDKFNVILGRVLSAIAIGFIVWIFLPGSETSDVQVQDSVAVMDRKSTDLGVYAGLAGYELLKSDAEPINMAMLIREKPASLVDSLRHGCAVIKGRFNNTKEPLTKTIALYEKVKVVCDSYSF